MASLCPHLAAVDATTTLSEAMPRSLLLLLLLLLLLHLVAVRDADPNLRAVLDLTGDTRRDLGCLPLRSNQQLQPTIAPKL